MRPIVRSVLIILLVSLGSLYPGLAAAQPGSDLENLEYRVSLGIWSEVALVHLRLVQVDQNRYRAEFSGATRGMWRIISRFLPERYETDMVREDGRLKPLVFREEFEAKGHHVRKEYRFDYARKTLEMWRSADNRQPEKRWQVALREPVYDLLSLFYNFRLGALGTLGGGENLRVALLPTPEPREMLFRIGSVANEARQVMLEMSEPVSEEETGPYFVVCNGQWVPTTAWTRVPVFGKLAGHLLNPLGIMKEGTVNLSHAPAPAREGPQTSSK